MSRCLPALAGMVALLAYAVADGYWTNRWSVPTALAEAPGRLAKVPLRVAEWEGEEMELDPRQARQGEIHASLIRRYKNLSTGETLQVILVCGRPGPIMAHAPERCMGGGGFALARPGARHLDPKDSPEGQAFWVGRFHKLGSALPEDFEVYWAWNARGSWEAPQRSRLNFARERAVFKLYILRQLSHPEEAAGVGISPGEESPSPVPDFLRAFVPEVNRCLFSDGNDQPSVAEAK